MALTVLMITVLPLSYVLTSAMSSAANTRQRAAALQLADSWMEVLSNSTLPTTNGAIITNHAQDPATFPGLSGTATQLPKSTLAGTPFVVRANFTTQSVNNQGQSDLCSSGQPSSPSHPSVILLQVTVTWNQGHNSVNDTTAVNYPKPGLQTEGFLAVQLSNSGSSSAYGAASDRLQAVPVTLQQTSQGNPSDPQLSPNPLTLHPDENGCVFAQVPTGTYDVSTGQPTAGMPSTFHGYTGFPPFVTVTGNTSATAINKTVNITAETIVYLDAFDAGITTTIGYGASTGVDQGVTCPGTSVVTCVASGNGTTEASAAWGGTGSTWSATTVSGAQNLSAWACTTGSSPTCVGVGNNSGAGVIRTTSSDPGTTSADAAPAGVTNVNQVACPSDHGCYALGTTAGGPVLLAGAVGQSSPQQDTWAIVAPPSTTFTALSSVACPTSSTCEVSGSAVVGTSPSAPVMLRLDGDPAGLATSPTWTPTFSTDTLPSTVTSVGKIVCPASVLCQAIGLGDATGPTDPTVLTSTIAATPTSTWSGESTFPSGAGSVSDISCTSTTCVAIGTASGTAAVWTGDLTASPHDWSVATGLPGGSISAVSAVACGFPVNGDDAACAITATAPNPSAPGQLLEGSLTGGSWAWNFATLPSNPKMRYYTGVACEPSPGGGQAACAATGATAAGPIILTSANGPAGAWTDRTPSTLAGALVTGIPVETAQATTTNWTPQVAGGNQSNASSLPSVLYPYANGYSIAAGDCPAEATSASVVSLNAAPGGTASATLPVGLLPLQVVSHTLVPVGGATVTLTPTTCGASSYHYTLPVTDANGVTRASVPYGTYSVTVNGVPTSPAVTLEVDTSTVTTFTNGVPGPIAYLPNLVVVASS